MASVKRVTGHHLKRFVVQAIAKGSKLRTDGWGAYRVVAKAGYEHDPIITGSGRKAVQTFPWIHTFIGNMKRMILGTHHWVSPKHLDDYLAEFTYRTNRRWLEANLFDRLVVAALDTKAITYKLESTEFPPTSCPSFSQFSWPAVSARFPDRPIGRPGV